MHIFCKFSILELLCPAFCGTFRRPQSKSGTTCERPVENAFSTAESVACSSIRPARRVSSAVAAPAYCVLEEDTSPSGTGTTRRASSSIADCAAGTSGGLTPTARGSGR